MIPPGNHADLQPPILPHASPAARTEPSGPVAKLPGIFLLLLFIFLVQPFPAQAGQATVFVYHRFGDDRYPSTNIAIEVFASQLEHLQEKGYTVLPLGEIVRRLRAGVDLPERCAALTVDDAYSSFLTGAMPLLRRFGFPATLFVSTGAIGHPGYLNWQQLRSLAAEGVEVGNHTVSHPYLLDRRRQEDEAAWRRRVQGEILRAQRKLEQEMGVAPKLFAYPFGEYSPKLASLVGGLGFTGAAAQQSGVIYPGSDLFLLPRFPMGGPYATLAGFREKLAMHPLPVSVLSPGSPVVKGEDPPALVVQIADGPADLTRLRCFVQGQGEGRIRPDPAIAGRFVVQANEPLEGRRNKYTLTAPAKSGGGWFWFSQLWVKPDRSEE